MPIFTAPAPPEALLEARPALLNEDLVQHPGQSPDAPPLPPPPRKYTKAVHEKICDELKRGQRPQGACARAGITVATFYDWIRKGKAGDPWLYAFTEDVELAYNEAEAKAVDTIAEAFNTEDRDLRNSEDAKWFLERARPDGYSKQVKTAVETQIKDFMLRLEAALDPSTFQKVLGIYLGNTPSGGQEVALLPAHGSPQETHSSE